MKIIENNFKFNGKLINRSKTDLIVLHHTLSHGTVESIHNYHKNTNKWAGIGYHFVVDKQGIIFRGRPEWAMGAHCLHNNSYSIGISAVGNYMKEEMPQVQKQAIIDLCKYLCNKYGIKDIKGHRDLNKTQCPGIKYPFTEIVDSVLEPAAKPKYNINFCKSFQEYYNTLTKKPLKVDGIYGPATQTAAESIIRILEDYKEE